MDSDFNGTGVALVTPFKKDLSIDFPALGRLLDHVANGGVNYLVICGTTGESVTLNQNEKSSLLEFIVENNKHNLPLVFGIGGNNTNECLDAIENTNLEGVNALLSVSPYYNKPSQDGIIRHYQTIADKSPVPVILYNVPSRTASNLSWKTTISLAKHPNIKGIKEASGNLEQCMRIRSIASDDFLLISGDDLLTGPIMSIGGIGVISVLANAFPEYFHAMMKAAENRDFHGLSKQTFKVMDINPYMYAEGNPVGIKEVLNQKGICSGEVRLPLISASEGLKSNISSALSQIEA